MKNITQALKVVTLALILSFGISYVYAWTAPTVTPPSGNVSAPINTSATGQYKEGVLGVGGLIRGYANAIFDGNVGIGTTSVPSYSPLYIKKDQNDDTTLFLDNQSAGNHASSRVYFQSNSGGGALQIYDANYTFGGRAHYADRFDVRADSLSSGLTMTASAPSGDIRLFTGGESPTDEKVRITSAGNVGIGISVPKSKLDVQSTFSVTQANGINTRRYSLVNFAGYGAIGSEWVPKVYTIRTPDTATSGEMYKYDVIGFSYGIGRPISLTYVGYLYGGAPTVITQGYSMDNAGVGINTWQDIGYDGHLYLHFGPISQYYNTFTLDYQSGATGETVDHIPAGYSVTLSN